MWLFLLPSLSRFLAKIVVARFARLGGCAAERVFFGDVTTGASNDLERAFDWALRMVSQWGFGEGLGKNGIANPQRLSLGLCEVVEREAGDLVNASYDEALGLMRQHRAVIESMSVERETLDRAAMDSIWRAADHDDTDPFTQELLAFGNTNAIG